MPLEIVDEFRDSAFARAQTGLLFNLPAPPDCEQLPAGLSLCMIVKNEERFLAACLESVRGVVDEIIVVDTGSTDGTVEIARSFGANVVFREWRNDFSWARNESLALATRRWTLVLDADEEVTPDSLALLRALRDTPAGVTGVYVQIQNDVDDASGAASTMTHVLPRLFPTTPRIRYRNVIHESAVLDDEAYLLSVVSPIVVRHKGYTAAIVGERGKHERNRPLLERAIREAADDAFSWFNFGTSAVASGDFDTAIEALERMFAMSGPMRAFFPIAYAMLAQAYAEGPKDLERGLKVVDDGLAAFPAHPNIVFTKGYLLAEAGRYDEARSEYEQAMAGQFEAARHSMVDDEIFTWKSALNIATSYVKENRVAEAIPWFERALDSKAESSMLRGVLASAYEKVGRYYDAEQRFRDAGERDGQAGFVSYVNYLMRRHRFAEAFDRVDHRRDAIDDATYAALLVSAARVTRDERLGDPEPFALRALKLAPGNGAALAFLDGLYETYGESAKRDGLRAAELDAPLSAATDFARRSHRLLQEQRPGEALTAACAGLAVAPNDAVLSYNAGLAAARLRRDAEAIAFLDSVASADSHATAALALRAEIERRGGDLDAAVATLERVRSLPAPDEALLRNATLGLAGALLEAGRVADAGKLAAFVLN